MNYLCQLEKKLSEDEAGVHHYKWACSSCGREYGQEFRQPHWSTIEIARSLGRHIHIDPVPLVQPGVCPNSASRVRLERTSEAAYCAV